jgi:hypothetical protein
MALLAIRHISDRSQWPRGLRRTSAAACFLGLRVLIPPGTWIVVSRERCELLCRSQATLRSLIQRSPTEVFCVQVSVSAMEAPLGGRQFPQWLPNRKDLPT